MAGVCGAAGMGLLLPGFAPTILQPRVAIARRNVFRAIPVEGFDPDDDAAFDRGAKVG